LANGSPEVRACGAHGGAHRLRIALIVNRLPVGGLERFVTWLACGLDRSRFESHIACLVEGGPLANAAAAAGIPVTRLDGRSSLSARGLLSSAACFPRLVRWMRALGPHVVQTHLFYAQVLGGSAARLCGVPALVHVEQNFYRWKGAGARFLERAVAAPHGVLVTPTRVLADHHRERLALPAERVHVIPNGVPLPRTSTAAAAAVAGSEARRALRRRLSLAPDHVVVGLAERMVEPKRQDVLLAAVARAARAERSLRLLLVGDGPRRRALEEIAARGPLAGRVRFVGEVADPLPFLECLDMYATASTMEGFGIAPVEAASLGLPVVAPDVPVFRETLPEGSLLAADDDDLARCVALLARRPGLARALGEEGRRHALRRFDLGGMVRAYEALYEGLAKPLHRPDKFVDFVIRAMLE
jgi:glycosyltransferase involved in cell wall biosynthesis